MAKGVSDCRRTYAYANPNNINNVKKLNLS